MKVLVENGAFEPERAHVTDAGLDLRSMERGFVPAKGSRAFETGVHIELPHNTCGLLVSKSGLNTKHKITSTGLIDEGYQGSIVVRLYNDSDVPYFVERGDKITQLVVIPCLYVEVERVGGIAEETERGSNGFGSTGR